MSDTLIDKYSEEVTEHKSSLLEKHFVIVDDRNKLQICAIFENVEDAKRWISANVNYYNRMLKNEEYPKNQQDILKQKQYYQDLHIKRIKILED